MNERTNESNKSRLRLWRVFALALALVVALAPMSYSLASSANGAWYIKTPKGGNLNLRTGPGTNYRVITSFAPGTSVNVLVKGAKWWKVSIKGCVGYVDAKYLSQKCPAPAPKPAPSYKTGVVCLTSPASALNLYSEATSKSVLLAQVYNGQKLTILGTSDDGKWYAVKVDGYKGYVGAKYVTVTP